MKGLNPGVISKVIQLTLTLKMTIAQVVETSVSVNNNSPIQDYVHPDDQTQPTFVKCILNIKRLFSMVFCTAKISSLNVERELTVFSFLLLRQYRIRVDELRKNKYKTLLATE